MRITLLTCLAATVATSAASQDNVSSAAAAPVEAFRAACLNTDMDRAAFEALAEARGWLARPHASSDDAPQEWGVRYADDAAQYLLLGSDETVRQRHGGSRSTTYPAFRNCTVAVVDPTGEWRAEMAALAEDLGYGRGREGLGPFVAAPAGGQAESWSKRGEGFIGWSHDPEAGVLKIEIYRTLDRRFGFP